MDNRRIAVAGFGIAWGNLVLLGLLIGQVGASRAYAVGLHTLFGEHALSVLVAGAAALILAALAARRLASIGELGLLFAFVVLADVVAGLGVIVAFGEITLVDLARVLVTETAMGTQLLAVGAGGCIGYFVPRRESRAPMEA